MRGHRAIGAKNSKSEPPADVESRPDPRSRQLEGEGAVADVDTDEVLGDWTGVEPETATPIGPRRRRHRSRFIIAAAAAAIIAVLVALVGLAVRRGEDSPSAARASHAEVGPGTGPVLLAPPMDGHPPILESEDGRVSPILYAAHGRSTEGFVRGAVRTPGGEIIGMTVPGPQRCCGGMGGSEMIGGRTVQVFMAGGDVRWAYNVFEGFEGCYDVRVTTSAGLEPSGSPPSYHLPPDVVTFFEHLTLTGRVVTERLPPGWQSLGVAASSDRYTMRFVDEAPAVATLPEFELDQRPNTGVGVFLADPRATNPRPTTVSGRPGWLITGDRGWITLVFDHDGTAVSLGVRGMTDEQLVAYAATLVPQPWSETLALVDARSATRPPVDEQLPEGLPLSDYCDVSLELIEHDPTTPASP